MDLKASIRPATPEDLPTILAIEQKVHLAPWTEEHFRQELEKPYSELWVVTDDETDSRIIGYLSFQTLLEECQILNVVVDLPYRGLGYALYMLSRAVNLGVRAGAKKMMLDVRKSNLPAIQLYQKAGFTITQVRKKQYSNGEDAYQMELDLASSLPLPQDF